ncbi:MAG: hypothetical protein SNJ52_03440 [Verrucomicrobiia bacterium]
MAVLGLTMFLRLLLATAFIGAFVWTTRPGRESLMPLNDEVPVLARSRGKSEGDEERRLGSSLFGG